jgi:hypothetical protein
MQFSNHVQYSVMITDCLVKIVHAMQHCLDGQAGFASIFAAKPILIGDVTIVLCTPAMKQWARKYIPGRVLIMDSTFGVNQLGYSLFALMAMGHQGQGVPVAFMITKTETTENITTGLKQLRCFFDEGTTTEDPPAAVRPSTTLTDDSTAEQNALGYDIIDACSVKLRFCFAPTLKFRSSFALLSLQSQSGSAFREVFEEAVQGLCSYHVRTAIQQGLQQRLLGGGEEKEAAYRVFNHHVEEIMYMRPCADKEATRKDAKKRMSEFRTQYVVLACLCLHTLTMRLHGTF